MIGRQPDLPSCHSSTILMSPPSLSQFATDLTRHGLVSSEQLQTYLASPGEIVDSVADQVLASRLREAGLLTDFQIAALSAGRVGELTFGNYLVLDKIGEGGMGAVFRARHRRMKRIVAIKVLQRERLGSRERQERFQSEIETVAQLSHPNIVAAFDADECALGLFLVMEYVSGSDLAQLVETGGPLSIRDAVDYIIQAARALEYAHSQNIVHRDVKPANMLRNHNGTVKVTDLGLAQFIDDPDQETISAGATRRNGGISGTVDYMAPEQLDAGAQADHRVDVYSLGCTLFFLLTGKVLFRAPSIVQRLVAHREQAPPALREFRVDVGTDLEQVYLRMTAKKPHERIESMTAVIEALEACELPEIEPRGTVDQQFAGVDLSAPTSWVDGSSIGLSEASLLLVEPSRLQTRMITSQLQSLGLQRVQTATSGQAAFETMLATRPELVVSAMHLPDMTGAELVQRIRNHDVLRDTSFVLISSETDRGLLEAVRQAGTAAILPKPFDLGALRKALCVAVDFLSPDAVRIHNLHVAGLRVVIADDSRSARRHVRRVLENMGIDNIREGSDGRQALALLKAAPGDLLITDYHMPELDGPALVRQIRCNPHMQNLPVLMLTSETDTAALALAREAGVSAVCDKVFDPHTVCGILGTILAPRPGAN